MHVRTKPIWRVELLGQMRASAGDAVLTQFGSRKVAALLARLALFPRRAHAREELIDLLWPDATPDVGRNRLRQALSTLKQLLERGPALGAPVLTADRVGVRVVEGTLACDAVEFEANVRAGRLVEARALYRGELLPGFFDEWIGDERIRLAALFDRLDDAAMAALPAAVVARREDDTTQLRAPDIALAAIPHYLTRYFPDAQDGALLRACGEHRLVTLLGPGGAGKTRRAVELMHRVVRMRADPQPALSAPAFDLVAFVPLVTCTRKDQVLDALAAVLQVRSGDGDLQEAIEGALAARRVLLALDNCEQLAGIMADLIAVWLARLPLLHVIATSRRALDIDGEQQWAVAPLPLPAPDDSAEAAAVFAALALFVDRARAVRADFHVSARNRTALIELVRVLDGMPLAIELAAARVRSIAPADMLARLRTMATAVTCESVDQRPQLTLLERHGRRAGSDPRHASMHQVIAWSWNLLTPAQAALLAAMTVFHGGANAACIGAVCVESGADAALLLDELVAHSLVQMREAENGTIRFFLSAPIREFAAMQIEAGQLRAVRARHRDWLVHWGESMGPTPPLAEVRAELDNVAAAISGALVDDAGEDAARVVLALREGLADVRLPLAAVEALDAVTLRVGNAELKSRLHTLLGRLSFDAGRGESALRHAEAGLALAPLTPVTASERAMRARALHACASLRWHVQRDRDGVDALLAEAAALATDLDDVAVLASVAALRAMLATARDRDPVRGEALHRQALAYWQRQGNANAINSGMYNLTVSALRARRYHDALARAADVVESSLRLQDWANLSAAHNVRANALCELRRWDEAVAAYRLAIDVAWRAIGHRQLAFCLWNLPRALAHTRQPEAAAQLGAFATLFWQQRFGTLDAQDRRDVRRLRRLVATQIGPAAFDRQASRGERLALPAAVALAQGRANWSDWADGAASAGPT